jgi:alkylation response protein AidB-like acyl-CoA dehydrogenase
VCVCVCVCVRALRIRLINNPPFDCSLGVGFPVVCAGRMHHVMRLLGASERALDLAVHRAQTRTAFGALLSTQGALLADLARCRYEIDQARYGIPRPLGPALLHSRFGCRPLGCA